MNYINEEKSIIKSTNKYYLNNWINLQIVK